MSSEEKDTRVGKNDLGISKGIYALGNSAKDGLIWGTIATIATFATLAIGRKEGAAPGMGNLIDRVARRLEHWNEKTKNVLFKVPSEWFTKTILKRDLSASATNSTTTAVAAIVGALVGKFAAVPAARSGLETARAAVKRYDDLKTENQQLITTNAALAEENRSFRDRLAPPAESFAGRAQAADNAESKAAARI